jgi:hypothetical protein
MKYLVLIFVFFVTACNNPHPDSEKHYVEFEPIAVIKGDYIKTSDLPRSATIFQYQKQYEHILNDTSDVYFGFKDRIADTLFDFDKYDYVFSCGREIDSLSYSKAFTEKYDACKSKEKTALEKIYKTNLNDSLLFIYRLKVKNKYTDPCG